jgi:UDP-N-acetylglucosamine 2-epimerase (non-hydrolysing)
MKIIHVAGARPNFMKVAPVMAALHEQGNHFEQLLVHTGQHYDYEMSQVFFEDLELSEPDVFLNIGSGSHAEQTARIMLAFEPVLMEHRPDWVVVVGDVNSTLACALVCTKLDVPAAHVEAGLRSWDRGMPEEINRLLTDQIADLLFTPSQDADRNLAREGIDPEKIHFVGNVMIDSLVRVLPAARSRPILRDLDLRKGSYMLVTLHRPSNVDEAKPLGEILAGLESLAHECPVIFPVHPRTRERMMQFELSAPSVRFLEPQRYLDFLALIDGARLVLTDSGGIQEETTYLGIPCITLRSSTERPITVQIGTNRLASSEQRAILSAVEEVGSMDRISGSIPPLWDGQASQRIAEVFRQLL